MVETGWEQFQSLLGLGLDVGDVGTLQMVLRTVVVYAASLVIVRLGNKRFLAEATAFDVIVGIMLGSVISRAINGSAPFIPTLVAGFALVAVHWLLSVLTARLDWIGPIVKGHPEVLVEDGKIRERGLYQSALSEHDLIQAVRLQTQQDGLDQVKRAYLERNGKVSVIPQKSDPRVVTLSVEEGVQTIRIELDGSAG